VSNPITRTNAAQASFVVLVLLIVLVVLIRAPSGGVDRDSVPEVLGESVARTPAETGEPSVEPFVEPFVRTGCFRSGSTRDEVRAVMGAPDSVDFGAWEYGESWVTFGYGVVLDFLNADGSLRLCE
jgi:hypothetical protein